MKLKYKLTAIFMIAILFINSILVFANVKTDDSSSEDKIMLKSNGVYAEHILPPGSSGSDLQTAINNAASGDVIIISSNITFISSITIPSGKEITIQSTSGNNWILYCTQSGQFHFNVAGSLVLQNITLDGGNTGGYVYVNTGNLTLNDGAIIQNCLTVNVAGGIYVSGGSVTMNGNSTVRNCSTGTTGGGIYMILSTFTMNDNSIITECSTASRADTNGGGVYAFVSTITINDNSTITNCSASNGGGIFVINTTLIMNSGNITRNTADLGAGIYDNSSNITIENATISENIANTNGGGIYLTNNGSIENIRNSSIINNRATNGNGGGIYTADINYSNLTSENTTTFDGNTASNVAIPPTDAETRYPNIRFASTSISTHLLNNYDINHETVYSIVYDANGGTGRYVTPDIIPGSTSTVLSFEDTGIERVDYVFTGWNTNQDGSGNNYQQGETITVNDFITLYAQWQFTGEYTVSFESNGGTSVDRQMIPVGETAIRPTDPIREGYIFQGWYTDDGTFENEWNFNNPITEDMTLYARWTTETDYRYIVILMIIMLIIILIIVIIFYKKCIKSKNR